MPTLICQEDLKAKWIENQYHPEMANKEPNCSGHRYLRNRMRQEIVRGAFDAQSLGVGLIDEPMSSGDVRAADPELQSVASCGMNN